MVFLFIFSIIILLLVFSKIRIEIENLKFTSQRYPRHINQDYKLIIKLCILKKIPILRINLTKTRLEKIELKKQIEKINFTELIDNKQFDMKLIKVLRKINIDIKNVNLKIEMGTENAALTAIIVPIVSTILSIIFSRKIKKEQNQKFEIKPIYINQNLINILFSGIFEIKMIHIINIIYILNKKEGVDRNERTSNRRTYDYSYE